MPCDPNDISIDIPSGPSGPSIGGFGTPFSINLPNINPFQSGFPEDLLSILDKLQLLIPPGALKPSLNLNFGKDIFDAIMKLLDQFFPFLMMYKFFLPILNIIICIIEVICAISNPFKLIPAIIKLFTQCIPAFLLLFPIFALIIMIISLLLLLIALIEYIIEQILKFIKVILKNVKMLVSAFEEANATSVLAIAKKLGAMLCIFQNLFVLLAIFGIIIQIIKDILAMAFAIPPCDDSGCCTPDVCPAFLKAGQYTNVTGKLQYLNNIGVSTDVQIPMPLPAIPISFNYSIRDESWQIFDTHQSQIEEFINIINAYDVAASSDNSPPYFKPIFFPTDVTYNKDTAAKQAAYTMDLRLFYNPISFGRTGLARFIKFKDCIVTKVPSSSLSLYNNLTSTVSNGVLKIVGGKGYEDDDVTVLTGFDSDGVTPTTDQANLNNFIHKTDVNTSTPIFSPTDGYLFSDVEYTFKPNMAVLLSKQIVTAGCMPDLSFAKNFINNTLAGDISLKTDSLKNILNDINFPNPDQAQQCLSTALSALRVNLTPQGVADFQSTSTLCLEKLKEDTINALTSVIGLGVDPCKSVFTAQPEIQFTTKPITVKVGLNENNGLSLVTGIPSDVALTLAQKIKGYPTFGEISNFTYDGSQYFTADLKSDNSGVGQLMISYDNNMFCKNSLDELTHTLQTLDYQFVYTPAQVPTSIGDQSDGSAPRRNDGSDISE